MIQITCKKESMLTFHLIIYLPKLLENRKLFYHFKILKVKVLIPKFRNVKSNSI